MRNFDTAILIVCILIVRTISTKSDATLDITKSMTEIFTRATTDIFDEDIDAAMSSILVNVYKGKYKHIFGESNTKPMSHTTPSAATPTPITVAKVIQVTKNLSFSLSVDEFYINKRLKDVEFLLDKQTEIPKFDPNVDELNVETRRFDKVLSEEKKYLRSSAELDKDYNEVQKKRTISLMQQFIYETRYQLPYAQMLRKKYINHLRYKIGYCFALLRTLKQQQLLIYTTLEKNWLNMMHILIHLKFYEKIMRLDVDIMDVVKFIRQMHKSYEEDLNKKKKKKKVKIGVTEENFFKQK